jgi:hypothetical protein
MQITAVTFTPDQDHYETYTRPDLVQICAREATLQYSDFMTGQPQTWQGMVYVKCPPEIAGGITGYHVDCALEFLRACWLNGGATLGSKVVVIKDLDFCTI